MNAQDKINQQVDGYELLCTLKLFGRPVETSTLSIGFVGAECDFNAALKWCVKNGYISKTAQNPINYGITSDGLNYVEEARDNPRLTIKNYGRWKNEAVTGMTESGHRSSMDCAAIPTQKRHGWSNRQPERLIYELEACDAARAEIAKIVGCCKSEVSDLVQNGRIAVCSGYKRERHIGRFRAVGGVPTKALCNNCHRRKRRAE